MAARVQVASGRIRSGSGVPLPILARIAILRNMKIYRIVFPLAAAALLFVASATPPARAAGPKKAVTITGEILDMGCYISRSLRGEVHRECALKCLASGIPMGLLGPDSTVYILSQHHDRAMAPASFAPPDPFQQCHQWPGKQVEVTGLLWVRKGYKELEVRGAKLAPPPPAKP